MIKWKKIQICFLFSDFKYYSPQNGIPSGVHCPLSHTRRAGPSSSNPRSHVYVAIVPLSNDSSVNSTVLWAGDPGKLHDCAIRIKKKREIIIEQFCWRW